MLSFTVIAVAATALNCGCAFAEMYSTVQVETATMGHCEQIEAKTNADSKECCVGCKLELGALNAVM